MSGANSPANREAGAAPLTRRSRARSIRRTARLPLFVLMILLTGCAPAADGQTMPAQVAAAPVVVREAYEFAVAHPELLSQIPCYCGCGAMGHTSNYACYVSSVGADGTPAYDLHALGCSICVDITRDARRLFEDGRPLADIRDEIDRTYAAFGPSNMAP